MQLKLYLNKFLKVDGIEHYSLSALLELRKAYDKFLELSGGTDPDFPMISLGDEKNSTKFGGDRNVSRFEKDQGDDFPDDMDIFNFTR
jgi:hypothetical protein